MQKILVTLFLGIGLLLEWQPTYAESKTSYALSPRQTARPSSLNDLFIQQFLSLTPKKYYKLTGKKMKLSQKISLKLAQGKIKRMIRKGKPVNLVAMSKGIDTSDFHLVGFLLGLVLIIGLLIAYIIADEVMIKWAWVGTAVMAAIILLAVLL